jgi:RimJ/RimL family protein N-acetyltransferase
VVDAKPPIGIIYLTTSSNSNVIEEAGELNIGIILDPKHRGCGYAHQAVELVLAYAFDKVKCHRVQAILMDNHRKDSALALFTQLYVTRFLRCLLI